MERNKERKGISGKRKEGEKKRHGERNKGRQNEK
jgi:hypothetical protein